MASGSPVSLSGFGRPERRGRDTCPSAISRSRSGPVLGAEPSSAALTEFFMRIKVASPGRAEQEGPVAWLNCKDCGVESPGPSRRAIAAWSAGGIVVLAPEHAATFTAVLGLAPATTQGSVGKSPTGSTSMALAAGRPLEPNTAASQAQSTCRAASRSSTTFFWLSSKRADRRVALPLRQLLLPIRLGVGRVLIDHQRHGADPVVVLHVHHFDALGRAAHL
jgi:hypothetical protein